MYTYEKFSFNIPLPQILSHFLSTFSLFLSGEQNNQLKTAPMTHRWVKAALTDDSLVANLLLRMKHSSDSDSLHAISQPNKLEAVITKSFLPRWGNQKNRSKSTVPLTAGKEQRGSPTTHLSWSGGSTSDESSRSGFRSVKANEVVSTSSYNNKSHKRKDLTSLRVNLNQQMTTSQNLKKIKINYGQNPRNKAKTCRVEAEIEGKESGFILPDLNMTPNDDLVMTMS